jgi:hypothetical protein
LLDHGTTERGQANKLTFQLLNIFVFALSLGSNVYSVAGPKDTYGAPNVGVKHAETTRAIKGQSARVRSSGGKMSTMICFIATAPACKTAR